MSSWGKDVSLAEKWAAERIGAARLMQQSISAVLTCVLSLAKGRFVRNVMWNLFGTGLPMLATLIAVPHLIHAIGTTRFGLLALVWMIVGYFSLFDFGLGRALTQVVAMRSGARDEETTRIVWTALVLMGLLGLFGAMLSAAAAPLGVGRYLAVPSYMKEETISAMLWAAAAIPFVVFTTGLRGLLEGHQKFAAANLLRGPMSVLTIVGPLMILPYTRELPSLVVTLVMIRIMGCAAHLAVCLHFFPELRRPSPGTSAQLRYLLSFGSWLTVSNIASPLLVYAPRIALAVMVSGASVAYFSTPSDMVTNFQIIPSIMATVLYPRFSGLLVTAPQEAGRLYRQANLLVASVMLPICGAAIALAHPALAWWIGPDFARQSAFVCQLLIIGTFLNGFAFLSEAVIQGAGRPDLTAKLNLAELVIYVPYLYFFIERYGVIGASIAWTVRIFISTFVQIFLVRYCVSSSRSTSSAFSREEIS